MPKNQINFFLSVISIIFFITCFKLLKICNSKILGFFIFLIYNFVSTFDPNIPLFQTPNTSNLKYLLDCSFFSLLKRDYFTIFLIDIFFTQFINKAG